MAQGRIALALGDAPEGRVAVFGARGEADLDPLDPGRTDVIQGYFPDHQALAARGFRALTAPDGRYDVAIVTAPRSRSEARARVAEALSHLAPGGTLWVEGQKTDGIDPLLKDLRARTEVGEPVAKAHGRIFRVTPPADGLADWAAQDISPAPGFVTRPGMFSADAPDPASVMLAAHLPEKLPARVADLGAGWGWLSAQILMRKGVQVLHMVEADHASLDYARRNVTDPRAQFHWADALRFTLSEPVNGVVMNPPFHDGRSAEPAIGAGFIRAAARLLTGAGRLWMVANRHLPYEPVLNENFSQVAEIAGDSRFKVITATGAKHGVRPVAKRGRR